MQDGNTREEESSALYDPGIKERNEGEIISCQFPPGSEKSPRFITVGYINLQCSQHPLNLLDSIFFSPIVYISLPPPRSFPALHCKLKGRHGSAKTSNLPPVAGCSIAHKPPPLPVSRWDKEPISTLKAPNTSAGFSCVRREDHGDLGYDTSVKTMLVIVNVCIVDGLMGNNDQLAELLFLCSSNSTRPHNDWTSHLSHCLVFQSLDVLWPLICIKDLQVRIRLRNTSN